MKTATLLNYSAYLILALLCVSSVGCGPNFGEKLVINKTDIFYKDGATREDAERLGAVLEKLEFIDGNKKSVQLLKQDGVWQFRIAASKGGNTEAIKQQMKLYCLEISSGGFNGETVEAHICNKKLESKSIVKGLRGKSYRLNKSLYYYKDVDLDQVKKFAAIAFATQIDTGDGAIFHLSQTGDTIEIRMVHSNPEDKRLAGRVNQTVMIASKKTFAGKQVDVLICDSFFNSKITYSSSDDAAAAPAS